MEEETLTGTPGTKVFNEAPIFMKESLTFPYSYGMEFIVKLMQKGGKEKAFAGVLKNPPHTTRQIMEPDTYLSGEKIEPMPVPDFKHDFKDYEKFDIGAMGEFDVAVLIEQYAGKPLSKQMYPEWRGGYYYAAKPKPDPDSEFVSTMRPSVCSTSRVGPAPRRPPSSPAIYAHSLQQRYKKAEETGTLGSRASRRAKCRFQSRTAEGPPRLDYRGRRGSDRGARRYSSRQREPGCTTTATFEKEVFTAPSAAK